MILGQALCLLQAAFHARVPLAGMQNRSERKRKGKRARDMEIGLSWPAGLRVLIFEQQAPTLCVMPFFIFKNASTFRSTHHPGSFIHTRSQKKEEENKDCSFTIGAGLGNAIIEKEGRNPAPVKRFKSNYLK